MPAARVPQTSYLRLTPLCALHGPRAPRSLTTTPICRPVRQPRISHQTAPRPGSCLCPRPPRETQYVRSSCPSAVWEDGLRSARTSHGPGAHKRCPSARNTPGNRCLQWWALRGSNPRPPPCKGACGGRERPGHRVECCSDQRRHLSLVVVGLQRFSTFHGLGTDLRRPQGRARPLGVRIPAVTASSAEPSIH